MHKRPLLCGLAVLFATVLVLTSFWLSMPARARANPGTRYVATTGADTAGNTCTSASYPCQTIQYAIGMAGPGDEIRVATGTYTATGTVATIADDVTIVGAYGPPPSFEGPDPDLYQTILDAQWAGSVVSMTNAGDVVLQHLTITHGDGTGSCGTDSCGGGIYATNTSLHVQACVITNNVGGAAGMGMGGGIYAYNPTAGLLDVSESHVISNTANANASSSMRGHGGGIYGRYGEVHLADNEVANNVGNAGYNGYGGGIRLRNVTSAQILTNTICGNKASVDDLCKGDGGGASISQSSGIYLAGNRIEDNWTNPNRAGDGGGIHIAESDAHLSGNYIISNSSGAPNATRRGGGVCIESSKPVTLSNNLIAHNDAFIYGGGVYVGNAYSPASQALLVNNTIVDNSSTGVVGWYYSDITLNNNLIAGHGAGLSNLDPLTGTITADSNLFWNSHDPITGTNAIIEDPLLTADYHLQSGSPAVDKGLTIPWLTVDLEGNSRPSGTGYDIGAYEYYRRIFIPLVLKQYS